MTETSNRNTYAGGGCLGPFISFFLSLKTWGWSWWLLLHTPLGFIYVFYWLIFHSGWLD